MSCLISCLVIVVILKMQTHAYWTKQGRSGNPRENDACTLEQIMRDMNVR